jgi:acyl-CoA synthetase (AMP-forming)/AMP-acid ligase II
MPVKSPYPEPPPSEDLNAHHIFFNRPDQKEWPDFTLYIDALTGYKRTYREFLERVYDGATALCASASEGGLGLRAEDGELVGILSENSMASWLQSLYCEFADMHFLQDYIALIHSLMVITVPYAMLSSYSTPFELSHGFRLSKITRLFVHPNLLAVAVTVAKEVGFPEDKIYILGDHVPGRTTFDQLVNHVRKSRIPWVAVRPAKKDTLAYLVFSSGTSGLPKG